MEIGNENVDPNCAQSVLLEHDYSSAMFCHNHDNRIENTHKVNNKMENDKKFHTAFKTVDKWADNVILRLPTGVDRKKIVDREITIHKVKYPFLPEQQIRGKVYKKFGIPTVMGSLLSRRRDQKKMVDTKKWHSMQELSENEDKIDEKTQNSILDIFKNGSQLKPELSATEPLDQVSIHSQPTQIMPFVFEATNLLEKPNLYDEPKILKESMNLDCDIEDLPTQKYERGSRNYPEPDVNGNLPSKYFLQTERIPGEKRKINASPATKTHEDERNCKKLKINEDLPKTQIQLSEKTRGKKRKISGSPTAAMIEEKENLKKTKISVSSGLENSQDDDFVTLDHSYSSSGPNENSQRLTPFSVIAKSGQLFYENSGIGKSAKRDDIEDKENKENRLCEEKEEGIILLDEFSALGKNIVLSPIVFSPVPKLANDCSEIPPEKSMLKHLSKSSYPHGNYSKWDTTSKWRDPTNFKDSDMLETPNDSEVIVRPASSDFGWHISSHSFDDDLSNQCCEYDQDITETSKPPDSAIYFHNLELISKNVLKIDSNPEEFEMREKIEELLQSLQNESF